MNRKKITRPTDFRAWTPDFDEWPERWMGMEEDLDYGRRLLPYFADFLQAFIDQLSGEVDVHVVFEVHGDVGQAEQADRADLLHLRQACQRRLHRRGQQLLDVLGGQAGGFGVDVDLGRGDIRKGVDGHRANRADPLERDYQEHDQDQEFVA